MTQSHQSLLKDRNGICFLILLVVHLQVAKAAVKGADGLVKIKIRTFRAVSGYNSTVASCYTQGDHPNLKVSWKKDGRHIDDVADNRFSSSVRIKSGPSTHFYLDFNPALSSDNNTVITCQLDGEKESESARLIVFDSAPIVKAIGDGVVTLQERSLFHPQVQIDFQGGQLYLIVSQNGKAFQQTSVDGVYGTKDVLLSPIRVDVKMNGRLSIIAFMDGLRFIYDIFCLIVVNQTATAAFSPPPSSPSSYDGDPTTESIGDSDSSSRGSSAKNTTPAITPIPPSPTSTSPMSTSPTSTSTSWAVIAGLVGVLLAILVAVLVLIYKLRNKTPISRDDPEGIVETSPRRLPAAPSHISTDSGLTQCEENSVTDSEQLEPNSRVINERDETTVAIEPTLDPLTDNRIVPLRRISQSEIVYDEERDFLGSGCSGEVYRARLRKSSDVVAIKVFLKRRILPQQSTLLDKEARILLRIKPHPHILSLIGISASPGFYALVMEYIGGGDLFQVLTSTDDRSIELWDNRLHIANQIALGMSHLHKNEPTVIHLDLKSNNVLVNKKTRGGRTIYICKICDFGLAKMTNVSSVTQYRQEGQTPGGTVTYIAPERYQAVTYGAEDGKEKREIAKKSDVFSYGILLWEIKERERPYEGMPNEAIHLRTKEGCPLPKGKVEAPRDYTSLLSNCVRFNPLERPSFDEIVSFLGTKQTTL